MGGTADARTTLLLLLDYLTPSFPRGICWRRQSKPIVKDITLNADISEHLLLHRLNGRIKTDVPEEVLFGRLELTCEVGRWSGDFSFDALRWSELAMCLVGFENRTSGDDVCLSKECVSLACLITLVRRYVCFSSFHHPSHTPFEGYSHLFGAAWHMHLPWRGSETGKHDEEKLGNACQKVVNMTSLTILRPCPSSSRDLAFVYYNSCLRRLITARRSACQSDKETSPIRMRDGLAIQHVDRNTSSVSHGQDDGFLLEEQERFQGR